MPMFLPNPSECQLQITMKINLFSLGYLPSDYELKIIESLRIFTMRSQRGPMSSKNPPPQSFTTPSATGFRLREATGYRFRETTVTALYDVHPPTIQQKLRSPGSTVRSQL
ncbi:hypothetical protein DPMN_119729 [Dreissena polymorpha]|uniref:Uncharacterized protein n=1 Tax=Dreissena polymorpha TaxID=45954 RepID=A0A9D4JRI6_DREPO|nr:hypothetical protein DPMN_119729 [Dreissena polymorpha]